MLSYEMRSLEQLSKVLTQSLIDLQEDLSGNKSVDKNKLNEEITNLKNNLKRMNTIIKDLDSSTQYHVEEISLLEERHFDVKIDKLACQLYNETPGQQEFARKLYQESKYWEER